MKRPASAESLGVPLIPPPAAVSVLGAARSGQAAAALLAAKGYRVYLSDMANNKRLQADCHTLLDLGVRVELGRHDRDRLLASDFIVVSPGIDERKGVLVEPGIREIPLFGELEIGYWFCPVPVAAVTGTDGKSTTTALLGHIMNKAGVNCTVAGNIGYAFCRAVRELSTEELIVVEVSSYQLHTIRSFHPQVGLLLNFSPDHLDRYADETAYYKTKLRLFENMQSGDTAVLNADQPVVVERAADVLKGKKRWFGIRESAGHMAFIRERSLFVRDSGGHPVEVMPLCEFPLPGAHNVENLLAAAAAAASLGLDPKAVSVGARTFEGLPHRLERVLAAEGVTWINDSKATTVAAVLRALQSLEDPIILIMGGRHKGAPYSPLVDEVRARVKRLVLIGEAAGLIERELGHAAPVTRSESFEEAVKAAWTFAGPGDTVLLSPGCASFDMFTDFEERGDKFRLLARKVVTDVSQV